MPSNVVPSNGEISVSVKLFLVLRSEKLPPWSEGRDMTSFQSSVTSFLFQYRRICNKANNANYKLDMETFLDKKKKIIVDETLAAKKNVCLHIDTH